MKQSFALLGGRTLVIYLPETEEELNRGYIGREVLEGEGMLFRFSRPCLIPLTMEEMKVPLDIEWIKNGEIDTLVENFSGRLIAGIGEAAIELPAGYAGKAGLKRGAKFELIEDGRNYRVNA